MNIKFIVFALCVVLALEFGIFAGVPFVDSLLPWVAAFAVVSAFWPIVALVLGAFGVLVVDKDEKTGHVKVNMIYDYDRPGHKFGYLMSLALGKTVRVVRQGVSSTFNKLGKWTEPKKGKGRRIIVQPLFSKDKD